MANILIADDEKEIVRLLRMYLEANNNRVLEANDGEEALQLLAREQIDLAIVDIMMPKKNGYEIIKEIRKGHYIPILVISAKTQLSDRVFGMDLGADDYITKPFEPLEVAAKVRAHLRRTGILSCETDGKNANDARNEEQNEDTIRIGNLVLKCDECVLIRNGMTQDLTKAEFRVLELFMKHPRRVFTKEQIYEYAWGDDYEVDDNTIRVIISRLRDKVGNDSIKTIRGLGYRWETNE